MINPLSNPSYLLPPLIAVSIIVGLLILVWRGSPRDFSSRLLCGLLLSLGLWSLLTFGMRSSPDVDHALLWEKALVVAGVPVFVLYYHFTLVYTNIRRRKWILPTIYSFLVVFVVLSAATDLAIKGMSLIDMSEKLNTSSQRLRKFCKKNEIFYRKEMGRKEKRDYSPVDKLVKKGMSLTNISEKLNIPISTLWRYLQRRNIPYKRMMELK